MADTLDALQNQHGLAQLYLDTLDEITRAAIIGFSGDDARDAAALGRLRALQMMRRDIAALAFPPGADDPANDIPAASF